MSNHDHNKTQDRYLQDAEHGCEESRLLISRRAMLGVSASLCAWAFMPKIAEAAGQDTRLLVVILRGGMDGLHVAFPAGEYGRYADLRSNPSFELALDNDELVDVGTEGGAGNYKINKRLPFFASQFAAKNAALVQAIAPPLRNRSHFQCLQNLENGLGDVVTGIQDGWLNRLLQVLPQGNSVNPINAIQVGRSPLILRGPASVLSWSPAAWGGIPGPFSNKLQEYYGSSSELGKLFKAGNDAVARAGSPDSSFNSLQRAFSGAGSYMKQSDGPRIAVLNVDGWDVHASQKPLISNTLQSLDDGLSKFKSALGNDAWNKTIVICVSEFGRSARVNGTEGTDHGTGTCALLLGGAVNGKRVFGEWPGLGTRDLEIGRDLRATRDTRQLFMGILQDHLGVPKTLFPAIFPGVDVNRTAPLQGLVKNPVVPSAARMAMASSLGQQEVAPPPRKPSPIARYRAANGLN
jgi:uncharacterized protein (DUF1501 family)